MNTELTSLEATALEALMTNQNANGGDFGFVEEVKWANRKQLGALVTCLSQKGLISVDAPTKIDGFKVTQFVVNSMID